MPTGFENLTASLKNNNRHYKVTYSKSNLKRDFKKNVKLNFSTENNTSFPLGNFDKLLFRKKLQTLCVLRTKKM